MQMTKPEATVCMHIKISLQLMEGNSVTGSCLVLLFMGFNTGQQQNAFMILTPVQKQLIP